MDTIFLSTTQKGITGMNQKLMLPSGIRQNSKAGGPQGTALAKAVSISPVRGRETSKNRFENAVAIGNATVVLADVSGSMVGVVGNVTKFELLRLALTNLWPSLPGAHLVGFSSEAHAVSNPEDLPLPNGGTALAEALLLAASFRPSRTVLISDGHPDNAEAALAASFRVGGYLDVLYCGPSDDLTAIAFMRRLAEGRNGRVVIVPMTVAHHNIFEDPLRRLLAK